MAADEHPFDRVVRLLRESGEQVKHLSDDRVRATCPAHPDRRPSLVVTCRESTVLLKCFAGCPTPQIVEALGLHIRDLFPGERTARARAAIVATYDYTDREGTLRAQKVRSATKEFWWRRPDPTARSGWRAGLADVRCPALFGWPDLCGASLVFITEGEKGVDRLRSLGLVATCGSAGASSWRATPDLLDAVAPGAVIFILPDNDQPGERHAERVARDIHEHRGKKGVTVKVVPLPTLPPGGDVFDFLADHTREELVALATAAPLWSPDAKERRRAENRRAHTRERVQRHRARMRGDTSRRASRSVKSGATLDAALAAVVALLEIAEPRSAHAIWMALNGGPHSRTTIGRALEFGARSGLLHVGGSAGQRGRAQLYRRAISDIHSVTSPGNSATGFRTISAFTVADPGDFPKEDRASQFPVTRNAVTQRERSSYSLQKTLTRALHSSVTEPGHLSEIHSVTGSGNSGTDSSAAANSGTREPGEVDRGENGADVSQMREPLADERQRDVERGYCRGCASPGDLPWCRLCRWSPTYYRREMTASEGALLSV